MRPYLVATRFDMPNETNSPKKYNVRRCDHCGARRQMQPGQRFCDDLCRVRWHNAERAKLMELGKAALQQRGTDG